MKRILSLTLALLLLLSCEYKTHDIHYVEKEPPVPNKQTEINLAGVQPNDTVFIYEKTWLSYIINIPKSDILKMEISLDDVPIVEENNWNTILIDPEVFDNANHKLNLSIEFKTNTHSIAEQLGLEKHTGEYEYILKYVKVNNELQIRDDITEDNYLKIVWTKPNVEKVEVEKYEITYNKDWSWDSSITDIITDPDQTFIIDRNYVHGYKNYQIKTYFKNNKLKPWVSYYAMSYAPLDGKSIVIEEINMEKAKVSWPKNKYKCSYYLKNYVGLYEMGSYEAEDVKEINYSENSAIIQISAFPNMIFGSLGVFPEEYDPSFSEWSKIHFSKSYPSMHKDWHFSYFTPDTHANVLYGLGVYKIVQFDANNQQELAVKMINPLNYFYSDKISCSSITHKVSMLVDYLSTVYVLNNKMEILKEFKIRDDITYDNADDVFCLTDDDRIIVSGQSLPKELCIYNINGELQYKFLLPVTPYRSKLIASCDGRYLCYYNERNMKIYDVGKEKENLIYEQSISNLRKCDFQPRDKNKLVIQEGDSFYVLDIKSNVETGPVKGVYISTDPFTENMVYYDENYKENRYVKIIKQDMRTLIGQLRIAKEYNITLYNNTLIGSFNDHMTYNYYKNLSKYLKQ